MTELARQLQAVLFVRGEMVKWGELVEILAVPLEELQAAAEELGEYLSESALALVADSRGIEMVTAPEVSDVVRAFMDEETDELTKAAAETLAIVAYRGPLSRQEVSMIRGVESGPMLRQLERRSLVRRTTTEARVALYDLSVEAFKQLGIKAREQLPDFELLSSNDRLEAFLQESDR